MHELLETGIADVKQVEVKEKLNIAEHR